MELAYKTCKACMTRLPSRQFAKDRSRSDGLSTYCRDCYLQLQDGATVAEIKERAGVIEFVPPGSKECPLCQEEKGLWEYAVDKSRDDGRCRYCKGCTARIRAGFRIKATPEWQEASQARREAAALKRRKKDRDRQQALRRDDPERAALYARARNKARRARGKGAEAALVTSRDLRRLYESPCAHCGCTRDIELDHIIPLSRGGAHRVGNIQPLCRECNRTKAGMLYADFRYRKATKGNIQPR